MKAIADKRKLKRKSDIPYRLNVSIETHSADQRREEIASNESAAEQTQQAAGEVVYRALQVPPQIRYAINKHKRKVAQEKQRTEEQCLATEQKDTPVSEQEPQAQEVPASQEQAKHEAQREAEKTNSVALPGETITPDQLPSVPEYSTTLTVQPDIPQTRPHSPRQSLPPKTGSMPGPQAHNSSRPEGTQEKAPSSSGIGPAEKRQTIDHSAPKQKPQANPKTKQYMEKRAAVKHIRPEKTASVKAKQIIIQRTAELGRRRFKKKQTVQQAQKAAKTTGAVLQLVGTTIGHAAKEISGRLIGLVGGIGLVVILCLVLLVAAVAASPFGIFFANEPSTDAIPLSSAVAQINMELNTRLMELQNGEYEAIEIHGAPPEWPEVIALFAAHIAGAEDSMDVALLDAHRVELLRDTFWDMCSITSEVETKEPPTTDGTELTEEPAETLHITIIAKNVEDMRTAYGFNDFQNEALDMLLAEESSINAIVGNLNIPQAETLAVLSNLPADLSPERQTVVQQALMLVGKVNYFWGGKSLVIGWDSRWGQLTRVSAAGSPTTGTYRPYGLDCSGFADWVFYNASGGDYIIGHGGGAASQHTYCTNISWAHAKPGDLVFYSDDSHVGIVGGWDEDGDILIIHCASGHNNVVITGKSGFTSVARPLYYGE